eukprot:COSAG06_NODE_3873_length_4814_cov_3.323648_4_plen_85_part_00
MSDGLYPLGALISVPGFYQDRLGTNESKTQEKDHHFEQGKLGGPEDSNQRCGLMRGGKVRKRYFFWSKFLDENDHFAKTGSGQT